MLITGTATYTIGSAGSPGTGDTSGNPGSATSFTFNGQTITGGGGGGGQYNTNVDGAGGTFSGGKGGAAGGNGSGSSGDSGGGGGGGVGGSATPANNGAAGDHGAALTDVSGLAAALTALGYNYTSVGLGSVSGTGGNNNRGANATGVGCGGGGGGYYGGGGGDGYFGGGGGGASGYGQTWTGGSGGSGFVAIKRLTSGVVAYDFLTTSGSYVVPTGTTEMKVWAVGAGGGGAGSTSNDGVSGGAGGAGGLSFLELGPILSLNFNAGDLTATGSVTLSADQTLTYPSSGGVSDSGYATGWNITQGIRLSSFTTPASTLNRTYVAWYKGTQTASGGSYSPSVPIFGWTGNDVYWGFGLSAGKITVANGSQNVGTTTVSTDQWVMLTWTVTSVGVCNGFVNGVKEVTNISVNTTYPGVYKIGSGYNYAGTEAPTALDAIEIYDGILTDSEILAIYTDVSSPQASSGSVRASGGAVTTVTEDGVTYRIHTFTDSGTFNVSTAPAGSVIECLIVGGGGGGLLSGNGPGAGGAGGVLHGTLNAVTGSYAVTVGRGGAGSGNGYPGPGPGVTTVAENSSITIGATTYTAFRGGRGTTYNSPPSQGESGGSGGGTGNNNISSGVTPGGLATQTTQGALTGYGHNGGAGANIGNNSPYPAGGGGGAGAPGQNATSSRGGAGGAGIVNPITGSTVGQLVGGQYYIAGGGGGFDDTNFNLGGIGGGGTNARTFPSDASSYGTAALPNTGGGGGGGSRSWYGTDGGSGVVVIKYAYTPNTNILTTTGGTDTITESPGQATVVKHTFDTSGTFTITADLDTTATIKAWGAGGGGTTDGGIGGGGGYSTGTYTFVSGTTYTLIVGQGGGGVVGGRNAGGGGGGTGLQFVGNTTPIIVAGAGGGGAQGGAGRNAGAGGGATGGAGAGSGGAGGTQSAPGAGGSGSRRTGAAGIGRNGGYGSTGSQSSRFATGFGTGGWGSYNGGDAGSGGGGGGYWGGGEGGGDAGGFGGGGGSGYVHPTLVSSGVTTAGSGQTAGNNTDSDKTTAATGGIGGTNGSDGVNSSGFDGKFIISYSYVVSQDPGLYVSSTSIEAGGTVTATLITNSGNAEIAYAITGNVAASGIDVPFNGNISVVDGVGSLTIATTVNSASRSFPNNAAKFGGNVVVTQLNNSNTQVIYTSFNNQKLRTQSNQEIAIGRSLLYGKVNGYSESTTAILTVDADRARIVNNLGVANITTALDPMVYFVITSVPSVTSIGVKTDRGVGFFEQGETGYYRAITDQNDPRPIVIPGTAVSGPKQYWY